MGKTGGWQKEMTGSFRSDVLQGLEIAVERIYFGGL